MVPRKTLESSLDCKDIKPVNSKGNQPRVFIKKTDDEFKVEFFGHLTVKCILTGKDPDAGED